VEGGTRPIPTLASICNHLGLRCFCKFGGPTNTKMNTKIPNFAYPDSSAGIGIHRAHGMESVAVMLMCDSHEKTIQHLP
jgi:hypothetical protein